MTRQFFFFLIIGSFYSHVLKIYRLDRCGFCEKVRLRKEKNERILERY